MRDIPRRRERRAPEPVGWGPFYAWDRHHCTHVLSSSRSRASQSLLSKSSAVAGSTLSSALVVQPPSVLFPLDLGVRRLQTQRRCLCACSVLRTSSRETYPGSAGRASEFPLWAAAHVIRWGGSGSIDGPFVFDDRILTDIRGSRQPFLEW